MLNTARLIQVFVSGVFLGLLFFLFIFSCKSNEVKLDKPPEMQPIIDEVQESKIEPALKEKTVNALKECKAYSDKCYTDNIQLQNQIEDLNKKFEKQNEKIKELEDELAPFRAFKKGVLIFILIVAGLLLGYFIWTFRGVIFKLMGVP